MRFFFFFKTSTNSFSPGGNFGYPCRKTTANWCKSIKGRLDLDGLRSERKPIVKCQSLRATIIIRTTLATFVSSYIHSTVFVVSLWFSSKRIFTFFFLFFLSFSYVFNRLGKSKRESDNECDAVLLILFYGYTFF